jgi:hypothetical protein
MNAVVTGATKGIGREISIKLAVAGYNLAVCARKQSEIESLRNTLTKLNPSITVAGLSTDCTDARQVTDFANFVQQHFEHVDVLINNVGMFVPGSILDEDESDMLQQFEVNFHTAYSMSRIFGRQMRSRRYGHIINLGSIASVNPVAEAGSYTVTKFAMHGLTKVLRLEMMQHNVKVTEILPGSTLTSSWEGTSVDVSRFVSAEDVANAVIFCLSGSAGSNPDEIRITPLLGQI